MCSNNYLNDAEHGRSFGLTRVPSGVMPREDLLGRSLSSDLCVMHTLFFFNKMFWASLKAGWVLYIIDKLLHIGRLLNRRIAHGLVSI